MAFMIKKLKQLEILESDDLNYVTSKLVCEISSKTCMFGLCQSCKDNIITANEIDYNVNDKIVWPMCMPKKYEYGEEGNKRTTNKMVKAEREGSIRLDQFN
ncbi:unnamed protein product [Parnassius apollo]|uniref:(apollo) hypothetical protein n=1 Tax=Parnassius apollo TaxID=110799 RepID=A0A8S3WJ85_PARAO|nr:unnamed protein product [Parnassius apollo]